MDRDQVGLPAGRSVRFPKWTDLIGRAGFDTKALIPDPTLSLMRLVHAEAVPPELHIHAEASLCRIRSD